MPRSPFRNRKEFLEEAILLAHAGAVSLLTDAPMVRPGFLPEKGELKGEIQNAEASRQQVIDFRRGVDLLIARGGVDAGRIAFVGHSYNAHTGGILTGVEKRIGSFVLMAGVFADEEYIFDSVRLGGNAVSPEESATRRCAISFNNTRSTIPSISSAIARPASVLLQFGKDDEGIPENIARHYFELSPSPKRSRFTKPVTP